MRRHSKEAAFSTIQRSKSPNVGAACDPSESIRLRDASVYAVRNSPTKAVLTPHGGLFLTNCASSVNS